MIRVLLLIVLLPTFAMTQGIYASLDGSMAPLDLNGTVSIGYHTKGLHMGAGIGMSKVTFQNSVIKSYGLYHPVFIDISYIIPNRKFSPYIAARGGMLMSGKNNVLDSPIDIDGSSLSSVKVGAAFRKGGMYIVPFAHYSMQHFDKAGSRNVGVPCRIQGLGGGVNLVFY